jgi:DNA mismatch repair protein MutL
MRHAYFHKAIMTAYSGLLLPEHSPSYFLYFNIHPDAIDVNIHPTKTEIKFADEQAIFQILLAAAKEALGKFNVTPSLDFSTTTRLDIPTVPVGSIPVVAPQLQIDPTYDPFKAHTTRSTIPREWEQLYPSSANAQRSIELESTERESLLFNTPQITETTPLVQCNNGYILTPLDEGLMLIHQHRAHTYVLYKELKEQLFTSQVITQSLLFPEVIELMEDDLVTLQSLMPDLEKLGFALEQFSPHAYTISGVPALLGQKNPIETLLHVIHSVQDNGNSIQDQWQETMTLCLAQQMAIPQGKALTEIEMRDLVNRYMATNPSRYLPNGQTILSIITYEDIQKRF